MIIHADEKMQSEAAYVTEGLVNKRQSQDLLAVRCYPPRHPTAYVLVNFTSVSVHLDSFHQLS